MSAPEPEQKSAGRPILFATDFSAFSEPALEAAIGEARDRNAELVIAHVYPPPAKSAIDDVFVPGLSGEIEAATCDQAIRRLEPLLLRARKAGVSARALALEGSPERMVLESARSLDAALVVIGTHGRQGVRRLLLGSVAAKIVAGSPCPVLTVRPA
ncbi:MAG TPA: universal stress protein [Thermoanaerobaculia bacterium]